MFLAKRTEDMKGMLSLESANMKTETKQKHAICNGQVTFVDVLIQNKNISSFKFMELYVYLVSLTQNTPNILIAYQI